MEFGPLTTFPPFTFSVTNNLPPAFQIGELMILGNAPSSSAYNISPLAPANTFTFAGGGPGSIFVQGIASALQTNTLSVPIINNLAVALDVTSVNGIFSYQGAFTGTGSVIYHGNANTPSVNFPGTILLGGDNSGVLGDIRLVDGVILQFTSANALGPNTGTILFDTDTTAGGVLQPTVSGITLAQTIANSGATPIIFDLSLIPNGTLTVSDISSVNNPSIEVGWNEPTPLTNSTLIINNAITGSSSLTINSDATVQLNAGAEVNTYSGPTTINSGTLQPTAINALSNASVVVFANSPTAILDLSLADGQAVNGISGPGPGGTLILGQHVDALVIRGNSETYGGSIVLTSGAIQGEILIDLTAPGDTWTLTGTNNTFTGGMFIDMGTLVAGATNTFSPNSFIEVLIPDSLLNLNGFDNTIQYLANNGPTNLGSGTLTLTLPINGTSYGGAISGTGGITINSPAGNTWMLTAMGSNYSGPTTIISGALQPTTGDALSQNSTVVFANNPNAFLDLTVAGGQTVNGIAGPGPGGTVLLGGVGDDLFVFGNSQTFGGSLTGQGTTFTSISLGLNAGQTWTLTGTNNTYTGAMFVNSGTLEAGATNTFSPNAYIDVEAVAFLNLNNFDNTIAALADNGPTSLGSGTLTLNLIQPMGGVTYRGVISGTGGVTINSPAGNTWTLAPVASSSTYSGPTSILSGTVVTWETNALSQNSLVILGNNPLAILNLNNFNNTIAGLSGGGLPAAISCWALERSLSKAPTQRPIQESFQEQAPPV